jgi:hypothetical protein
VTTLSRKDYRTVMEMLRQCERDAERAFRVRARLFEKNLRRDERRTEPRLPTRA